MQRAIGPEILVLDVANIVGARAQHGWWRDRQGAATKLIADVAALDSFPHPLLDRWFPRVVAVVEGAARGAQPAGEVEVIEAQGSGDDAIVELVRQARPWETVRVITADRGLKERVMALGAETSGPGWLLALLDR